MTEYYFRTEKLTVGYNGAPLIEDIEIGLKKGEILTLIGPNGAGKSTVLKSIAGQLALLGGTVFLDGRSLTDMSRNELPKRMAIVLTERLRAERMSCGEVVATGRYPYTGRFGVLTEKDRLAVEEAMKLVQVDMIRDRDFTRISDGQRQRVLLARAICQEPEIVILDEPTSYLDIRYKLEFLSLLQEMCRKKKLTVVMSLHELDLAARISDRILCLRGRYAERFGTPEEIFAPGYLSGLFSVTAGSFDEANGNTELPAARGEPAVFVIAGGGCGRAVYRMLQRQGMPFAAGILYRNDLDYPSAKALAAKVVEARAFEPVPAGLCEEAKKLVDRCGRIICCRETFGTFEQANRELLDYARRSGKEIEMRVSGSGPAT